MKILFAVSSLSSGGAERVATTLCNAWVKRGIQITLVPTFSGQSKCFYSLDQGINLVFLADIVPSKKNSILVQIKRLLAFRTLIKQEKPDVIVSFLTNVNVAVLLASINLNIPVIVCERSNFLQMPISPLLRLQSNITYKWANLVTVQTTAAAQYFKNKKLKRIEIVPNPIPPELSYQNVILTNRGNVTEKKIIIAVGRLGPEKQFDLLINAFFSLADKNKTWNLYIFGEGPKRKELESLIDKLDLNERVCLPGRTNNPWEQMEKADVFVLTSYFEGFPNVLLEAMALGLPCISTDCKNGPREISNNGKDALLVPVGDLNALTQAIQLLMSNENLRLTLGEQASKSVIERYSIVKVLKIWDDLFEMLKINTDQ